MYVAVYAVLGENLHQTVFAKFNFAMQSWTSENSSYVSIESQLHIPFWQSKSVPYTDNLNWALVSRTMDIPNNQSSNNAEFQVTPTL